MKPAALALGPVETKCHFWFMSALCLLPETLHLKSILTWPHQANSLEEKLVKA